MSEQAKIASLQENIKEARNEERNNSIYGMVFAFCIGIGFVGYFNFGDLIFLLVGVIGVLGLFYFAVTSFRAGEKKTRLMKELDSLSMNVPICQKCHKQIPQGDYAFCPFCGAALESASA